MVPVLGFCYRQIFADIVTTHLRQDIIIVIYCRRLQFANRRGKLTQPAMEVVEYYVARHNNNSNNET